MAEGRRLSLKLKQGLTVILIMSLFTLAMVVIQYISSTEIAKQSGTEKARGDLATGEALIDAWYPGPWRVEGDSLYKGDVLINNNFEIVDKIGEMTGNTATIFLGDTRITTNVLDQDGNRAVGTQVSEQVAKEVLEAGRNYYGTADVVGHIYQTAYTPIRDANGEIIGIWYVGAPQQTIEEMKGRATFFTATAGIIALILGACMLVYMANRFVVNPLYSVAVGVKGYGEGDFTTKIEVKSNDEIGDIATSLNKMTEQLSVLMKDVVDNAQLIAAHSQQLAASNEEISATMEEVASITSEVSATAAKEFENATITASEAESVGQLAQQGNAITQQTVEKINSIANLSQQAARAVNNLGKFSAEIGNITNVINDIAEQTNLLALNAAIEAARAGETGRGFAVVAEEVRKLAEQSASATEDINQLIKQVQLAVEDTSLAMQSSEEEVKEGVQLVSEAGKSLEQINLSVHKMVESINEIVMGSKQSSEGMEQVASSTEQVTASVQQMTSASQELAEIAGKLQVGINKFKMD
ncbi:methyl-accepting chemotaxis protein [Desulfofalx alkaliphila]|uniref:methyl-accepting chemotaxis protein n=1 Tax=Desulfofalx alkaliphila TaxID=105483 RepID=UPI0004E1F8A6|nr:methyl-accepting chemotaxis protein [Desulfofalx alkaliphila]